METGAVLIGLAQIGVAMAGVTTIASVMVNTSVTTSRNLFIVRVFSVLLFSILLILGALAPILVSAADISGTRMWQTSSLLVQPALIFAGYVGFFILNRRAISDEKNNWWQTIFTNLLAVAGTTIFVLAIFSDHAKFLYTLALMLVLSGALFMMTTLILSFPIFERFYIEDPQSSETKK